MDTIGIGHWMRLTAVGLAMLIGLIMTVRPGRFALRNNQYGPGESSPAQTSMSLRTISFPTTAAHVLPPQTALATPLAGAAPPAKAA